MTGRGGGDLNNSRVEDNIFEHVQEFKCLGNTINS